MSDINYSRLKRLGMMLAISGVFLFLGDWLDIDQAGRAKLAFIGCLIGGVIY